MRAREQRNGVNSLLVLVAVCVLFFFLFANVITKKMLFAPGPATYDASLEELHFIEAADGGKLAVYWAPAAGAAKTVFYFHGNAEDLGDIAFVLRNYRLQGVNVLSFDYRGYGLSDGTPTERSAYADAETVLAHAEAEWGVDVRNVVLHGRSLGGGVAMELATREAVAGLILESAFLSAYRLYLPFKWLPGDKFVNSKKAGKVDCPVLVIHGRKDGVVPFGHGEELLTRFEDGQARSLWIDGAGHNDLLGVDSPRYWAAIRGFLASLPAGASQGATE